MDFPFLWPISGNYPVGAGPVGAHEGYDVNGWAAQAPVYASHTGRVTLLPLTTTHNGNTCWNQNDPNTPGKNPGRTIRIDHGNASGPNPPGYSSTYSRYHHLTSFAVSDGSWVAAGDLIGFEGNTGGTGCGEHLHFEYRRLCTGPGSCTPLDFSANMPQPLNTTALSPIAFHGVWDLNATNDSTVNKTVYFGLAGDIPVVGDWNGDGRDSVGVIRLAPDHVNYHWYLNNDDLNSHPGGGLGVHVGPFFYGVDGDIPVPGDWNNDNWDTPGIVRRSSNTQNTATNWWLTNNTTGGGIFITPWGSWPGRAPVVGDWDANGADTPGIYWPEGSSWWLTNTALAGGNGLAYTPFAWGQPVDVPMAGDWLQNNHDRPIVYQKFPNSPNTVLQWMRQTSLSAGSWDSFTYGGLNTYPMVLNWDADTIDEYASLR